MIPKGNQRGGGRQLATHLLNQFDNDNVEVLDLRGAVAQDLHGAFHEWYAQSKATRCRKYLYSLSVNPDLAKYDLTREQYLDFIARTERSLNLAGQPRAIVFHVKNGRQHCHTVWSRIDSDAGKAVQIAHDRLKLRAVAQEFARDHGLALPPGMRKNGRSDRFNERARQSSHREKQQQERSGISKEECMQAITIAWHEQKDPHAFVKTLEGEGYHLARGDSGRYVVIDQAGEVHSLYRQIDGVRSNEIKAFLAADYPLDKLRGVETARAAALQDRKEQEAGKKEAKEPPTFQERREEIARIHQERREKLETERARMEQRIETERASLLDLQAAEKDGLLAARAAKQPRGMLAFLARITGIQAYIAARHSRQDAVREKSHKAEREALDRRHGRERQERERRFAALAAVETRERQSLRIALRRHQFQRLLAARTFLAPLKPEFDRAVSPPQARRGGSDSLAAKGEQIKRDFENAADPRKAGRKTGGSGKDRLPALSSRLPMPFTKGELQRAFEQAKDPARKPASGQQEHTEEVDPGKLEQARKTKEDLEKRKPQTPGPERDRER